MIGEIIRDHAITVEILDADRATRPSREGTPAAEEPQVIAAMIPAAGFVFFLKVRDVGRRLPDERETVVGNVASRLVDERLPSSIVDADERESHGIAMLASAEKIHGGIKILRIPSATQNEFAEATAVTA